MAAKETEKLTEELAEIEKDIQTKEQQFLVNIKFISFKKKHMYKSYYFFIIVNFYFMNIIKLKFLLSFLYIYIFLNSKFLVNPCKYLSIKKKKCIFLF